MDRAIFEAFNYDQKDKQNRRNIRSKQIKNRLDADSRKRKNRMSLAERITGMRLLAETMNEETNHLDSTTQSSEDSLNRAKDDILDLMGKKDNKINYDKKDVAAQHFENEDDYE